MILLGKRFDIYQNGQKKAEVFGQETELIEWVREQEAPSLSWLLAHGWVVERVTWDAMDAIQGTTLPLVGMCLEDDHTCVSVSLAAYGCTLRAGHDGGHVAHSVSQLYPVFAWSEVTG